MCSLPTPPGRSSSISTLLLAGAWVLRVSGRRYLVLTGLLVLFTIGLTALFFGYVREGILILPLLFGVEGAALASAGEWLSRRIPAVARGPRIFGLPRALAVLLALFWLVGFAGAFQGRDFVVKGETMVGSKMLNPDSVMHIAPSGR